MRVKIETLGPTRQTGPEGPRLYLEAFVQCETPAQLLLDHKVLTAAKDAGASLTLLPSATYEVIEPLSDAELAAQQDRMHALSCMAVIESPYQGGKSWAVLYARLALAEQLGFGAIPFASHLLYTQVLLDNDPTSRRLGITAGWAPYACGARAEVYTDFGITLGMALGIAEAQRHGCTVVYRAFGAELRDQVSRSADRGEEAKFLLKDHNRSSVIVWP